jgi:transposase
MAKRYRITLTDEERARLVGLTRRGTASARMVRRAQTLLLASEGQTDEAIAEALHIGVSTVERTRRRCVEEGPDAALTERPRPGARPKLGPKEQAFVVALACTTPPAGRDRWTMQLLADRVVELNVAPDVSDEAIRRLLKRTGSSPGRRSSGASRRSARSSSGGWRTSSTGTPAPTTRPSRSSASTRPAPN